MGTNRRLPREAVYSRRGDELAMKLAPFGLKGCRLRKTCALIARHAVTHQRLTRLREKLLDNPPVALSVRMRAEEDRITMLAQSILTDEGPLGVLFLADPSHPTVRLTAPVPLMAALQRTDDVPAAL